jgi:pyruvate/2-oxoglutarate dehydrogenase complex dihydrolipoamide acyltransferase (E2) component
MKRRTRRDTETFSMSFLDCICCGFGAIILLLVLNEFGEPIQLEQAKVDLDAQIKTMEREIFDIRGMALVLERELRARIEQLREPVSPLPRATSALRPAIGSGDTSSTGELEVLRSLRRAMAQSMTLARDNVRECTVFDDADIEGWRQGGDYTVRLLRAIAAGCRAEPGLNAWFDGSTQGRRLFQSIHVGIAVDTSDGLLVPVIRDAGGRDAAALRAEVNRLKAGARDRSLPAADLRDFTIMLSNFGVMAGRYATPVVVPPAVAILGAGRISTDVVAVEGRIEAHRRIPLSLTFDHRCVTGGEAVRFLASVIEDLQLPE